MPQCNATDGPGLTPVELAEKLGGRLQGRPDPDAVLHRLAPLERAGPNEIAFVIAVERHRERLACSRAGAILAPADAKLPERRDGVYILVSQPYQAYARLSGWLGAGRRVREPGRHPSALIDASARIDPEAWVGAGAVVGPECRIGPGAVVEARCVLGRGVELGANSFLHPGVTLLDAVRVGERAILHSGAVLGADGFGFAPEADGSWRKIEQLAGVQVGDDVEIGANTTIDRGALTDTRIGNGVKIDNLVHIAHNCEIGDHTAIAGCVGIAGSARIGAHCAIGGGVGILGHLEIVDGVTLHAMTLVTRSIRVPGEYASGVPHQEARLWYRMMGRLRRLARPGSGRG